jgi:hypothetical protein
MLAGRVSPVCSAAHMAWRGSEEGSAGVVTADATPMDQAVRGAADKLSQLGTHEKSRRCTGHGGFHA